MRSSSPDNVDVAARGGLACLLAGRYAVRTESRMRVINPPATGQHLLMACSHEPSVASHGMKLVMTLLVRNEADIIETNLEYHLAQGVDFVIVTDHGSDDGTSDILREYERMGVAKVIRDDEEGHHQSRRVTRMADIARLQCGADWLIHNDADEFWWPLVGTLRDVFTAVPSQYGQIEVKRRNFRPIHENDDGPFYTRLVYREASSLTPSCQALEPKVAHRPHPQVVVAPGNHSISGADLAPVPAGEALEILHFPMRSYEQFERKVVQTGVGYEQLCDRSPQVGCDQLTLLEIYRAGKLREYYDGLVLHEDALERGLQMGTIVIDRRLESFMEDLRSGKQRGMRPDAPFAGDMLRRMMEALNELEQNREELATLRLEGARAREHIEHQQECIQREREHVQREREHAEHLQSQVTELSANLERYKNELQSTSQALHLLRSSRLMRSTAWARRLYYRAKGSSFRSESETTPN